MAATKVCKDCWEEKSLFQDFYPCPSTVDGGMPYCIPCHRKRATASVMKQRAERKALGLPVNASWVEVQQRRRLSTSTN